jgi:hypothetical protein
MNIYYVFYFTLFYSILFAHSNLPQMNSLKAQKFKAMAEEKRKITTNSQTFRVFNAVFDKTQKALMKNTGTTQDIQTIPHKIPNMKELNTIVKLSIRQNQIIQNKNV